MQFDNFSMILFKYVVSRRGKIIRLFKIIYCFLILLFLIGARSVYYADQYQPFFYSLAVAFGKSAVVIYILTLVPGIVRRFGLKHEIVAIVMILRRYLGILMYILVFTHYWWVRGINIWFHKIFVIPPPVFESVGFIALVLLTPIFLTSTDLAVAKLGKWWGRIHKLTYVVMFLILLHTALQRISIWSILVLLIVILQMTSYIYSRLKKRTITDKRDEVK